MPASENLVFLCEKAEVRGDIAVATSTSGEVFAAKKTSLQRRYYVRLQPKSGAINSKKYATPFLSACNAILAHIVPVFSRK